MDGASKNNGWRPGTPEKDTDLQAGDRVLGTYRGEQYRATVLSCPGDAVRIEWAAPHDVWGPATLDRAQVEFVSRPEAEDPLARVLPGRLVDGGDTGVKLQNAFAGCDAVGVYFCDGDTPLEDTERLVDARAALARRGRGLGIALYELAPGDVSHRARLPEDCLSVAPEVVALVIANFRVLEICRVRRLPSLCVLSRSGEVLTYDGLEALADVDGFPWRGFESAATRRAELKQKAISAAGSLLAAVLVLFGAARVGGWLLALGGYARDRLKRGG